MRRDVDEQIRALAQRQYGAFVVRQVYAAGGDRRLVARRVAAGLWERVDRDVFVLAGHEHTWHQHVMAATLGHEDAVASGPTAAALWGIDGFRPGRIEITIPTRCRRRSEIARVRRSDTVARRSVARIPVNAVPLVLVQIGADQPDRFAPAAQHAIITALTDVGRLRDTYTRWANRGVSGLGLLREFLDSYVDGAAIPESVLEQVLIDVITHPLIPDFVLQAPFPWYPRGPNRVDVLIPAWRLILEADGRLWHSRLQQMQADRQRDRAAVRNGYRVLRFGHAELTTEPHQARADVIGAGMHTRPSGLIVPAAAD